MFLRPVFCIAMHLICLAPGLAFEPTDKPAKKIEIRRAETSPADGLIRAKVTGTDKQLYLHETAVATSKEIAEVRLTMDARGKPAIEICFTVDGAKKIAKVTEEHHGKPLAILVDGNVISAPIVREKISRKTVISGNFSEKEASRIVKAMKDILAHSRETVD